MGLNKYCLGELLELLENNNSDLKFDASHVRGVNNLKKLMPTKVDVSDRDLRSSKLSGPGSLSLIIEHPETAQNSVLHTMMVHPPLSVQRTMWFLEYDLTAHQS